MDFTHSALHSVWRISDGFLAKRSAAASVHVLGKLQLCLGLASGVSLVCLTVNERPKAVCPSVLVLLRK